MKIHALLAVAVTAVSALSNGKNRQHSSGGQDIVSQEQYLVEVSPGETKWITEDEKWRMKRVR